MTFFNFKTLGHQTLTSEMAFLLYELDRDYFPTPWTFDAWKELLVSHQRFLMTLTVDSKVIGFCLFDQVAADSFAHLLKIIIHPTYRQKGCAQILLTDALSQQQGQGFSKFFLEVEESNIAAQALYTGLGFQKIHLKKDYYGNNRSAVIMTLGQ